MPVSGWEKIIAAVRGKKMAVVWAQFKQVTVVPVEPVKQKVPRGLAVLPLDYAPSTQVGL
jgi:hypothetical protein